MQRAFNLAVFDPAFGQKGEGVRANSVRRVDFAVEIIEGDVNAIDFHAESFALGDLVQRSRSRPCHLRHLSHWNLYNQYNIIFPSHNSGRTFAHRKMCNISAIAKEK